MNKYNINRFIIAQDKVYSNVINELKNGYKETHWMWFIFPQIKGLGYSTTSMYYGIESLDEAKQYLANPILLSRYNECCNILLNLNNTSIYEILGIVDSLKLQSSLTLFSLVSNNELYKKLLEKYFKNQLCEKTLVILNKGANYGNRTNH